MECENIKCEECKLNYCDCNPVPTYEEIKPYIEKKLVAEQVHPENEDVRIFNYTQMCQFSGDWDEVTKQCRGLILNIKTGEVLARPFKKFFNYQEHIAKNWPIPEEEPIITEKLDGSLGIMYTLNGKTWIATRGSFMSDQAIWATKWWRENKGDDPYGNEVTHLFEIIYPENRIVVSYDFSGLVHLASIHTKTGRQVESIMPVKKAEKIDSKNVIDLLKQDDPNSEGFVVYYPKANTRVKIKFPEYVRLHRIVTGVSEIAIWEMLRDEKPIDELLEKVPDEFYKWVSETQFKLLKQYSEIFTRCKNDFERIAHAGRSRKEIALDFQECKHPGILFAMLDGKDYRVPIWRMIRPHGQKQFKVDIDS